MSLKFKISDREYKIRGAVWEMGVWGFLIKVHFSKDQGYGRRPFLMLVEIFDWCAL